MSNATSLCELCGEPMPPGESMFKYHGRSGTCPKPPLQREVVETVDTLRAEVERLTAERDACKRVYEELLAMVRGECPSLLEDSEPWFNMDAKARDLTGEQK